MNNKTQDRLRTKLANKNDTKTKYVDVLDVDKPIAGQTFWCVSFITPSKILKQKEIFYFEEFLKKWELSKSMEKFNQFINFVSFKYKLSCDNLMADFEEFIKEENDNIIKSNIENDYKSFLDKNQDALDKKFNIKHNFQTSVSAVKNRGVFASQEEAELRAKMLREVDPSFDIFVGPVGQWLCWEPEAYKTGRMEYLEEELNQLCHEKNKNETNAKDAFEQRVKDTKRQAIQENIKNAEKSGNTLTQTIDKDGNLIDKDLPNDEPITVEAICAELFEGDNIVTKQTPCKSV